MQLLGLVGMPLTSGMLSRNRHQRLYDRLASVCLNRKQRRAVLVSCVDCRSCSRLTRPRWMRRQRRNQGLVANVASPKGRIVLAALLCAAAPGLFGSCLPTTSYSLVVGTLKHGGCMGRAGGLIRQEEALQWSLQRSSLVAGS